MGPFGAVGGWAPHTRARRREGCERTRAQPIPRINCRAPANPANSAGHNPVSGRTAGRQSGPHFSGHRKVRLIGRAAANTFASQARPMPQTAGPCRSEKRSASLTEGSLRRLRAFLSLAPLGSLHSSGVRESAILDDARQGFKPDKIPKKGWVKFCRARSVRSPRAALFSVCLRLLHRVDGSARAEARKKADQESGLQQSPHRLRLHVTETASALSGKVFQGDGYGPTSETAIIEVQGQGLSVAAACDGSATNSDLGSRCKDAEF